MNAHRNLCWTISVAVLLGGCRQQVKGQLQEKKPEVRPPAVAGAFYPANPVELKKAMKNFLDSVPDVKPSGDIVAAIAPHAGYRFSGQVAAYTHKLIADTDFDTVVIIGHDSHTPGVVAFVSPVDYFETPLGRVPVDRDMMKKMMEFNSGIRADESIHAREHTVEVHLPFLQLLGRTCKIVPVLFGNPTIENCRIFAEAIDSAAGAKKVFVLASTDLSHYPPYDEAKRVDNSTLEILRTLDVDELFAHLTRQEKQGVPGLRTAMCARGGVGTAILFATARGADTAQILRYANSGDVPLGDKQGVVGYSSVLIVRKERK